MKTLFLTASFADVAAHFPDFIGDALSGKSVAFIPTACDVEDITFFMDDDRNAFKKLGIRIDELDLAAMPRAELAQKIAACDFIFVGGGNTFYLLQEIKRSGLDGIIKEAVDSGKPYSRFPKKWHRIFLKLLNKGLYSKDCLCHFSGAPLYIGTSAGSMIAAPDIAYGADMDAPQKAPLLNDTQALHLVDFHLLPHYGNRPFARVTRAIYKQYRDTIDIRPVANHQYITVRGNDIRQHP